MKTGLKAKYVSCSLMLGCALLEAQSIAAAADNSWCNEIIARDSPLSAPLMAAALGTQFRYTTIRVEPTLVVMQADSSFAEAFIAAGLKPTPQSLDLAKYLNQNYSEIGIVPKDQQFFLPKFEEYKKSGWADVTNIEPVDSPIFYKNYSMNVLEKVNRVTEKNSDELHLIAKNIENRPEGIAASTQARFLDELINSSYVNIYKPMFLNQKVGIPKLDLLVSAWDKGNFAATHLIENKNTGFVSTDSKILAQWAMADSLNSDQDLIKVSILPEDVVGNKMENLTVKYMSKAAFELKCPLSSAFKFATKSYKATQILKRSAWYIWIENEGKSVVEPSLFNFTTIDQSEYVDVVKVN
jgi:hypothetical protein